MTNCVKTPAQRGARGRIAFVAAVLAVLLLLAVSALRAPGVRYGKEPQGSEALADIVRRSGNNCAEVVRFKEAWDDGPYYVRCFDNAGSFITVDYTADPRAGGVARR
jgi:hypothetical protein